MWICLSWSGADATGLPGFVGIGAQGLGDAEIAVALDWQAKLAAHGIQFGNAHAAEFGTAQAQVAQPESDIRVFRAKMMRPARRDRATR